jgi:hypothetical protein
MKNWRGMEWGLDVEWFNLLIELRALYGLVTLFDSFVKENICYTRIILTLKNTLLLVISDNMM